jgi:hypothetical protein
VSLNLADFIQTGDATIDAALGRAVAALGTRHRQINVPAGTWLLGSMFSPTVEGLRLVGEGRKGSIFRGKDGANLEALISLRGPGQELARLGLDGNRWNGGTRMQCVQVADYDQLFERLEVYDGAGCGIGLLSSGGRLEIRSTVVRHNGDPKGPLGTGVAAWGGSEQAYFDGLEVRGGWYHENHGAVRGAGGYEGSAFGLNARNVLIDGATITNCWNRGGMIVDATVNGVDAYWKVVNSRIGTIGQDPESTSGIEVTNKKFVFENLLFYTAPRRGSGIVIEPINDRDAGDAKIANCQVVGYATAYALGAHPGGGRSVGVQILNCQASDNDIGLDVAPGSRSVSVGFCRLNDRVNTPVRGRSEIGQWVAVEA